MNAASKQIDLSGSGGSGAAPTGGATGVAALQDKANTGGGLINKALMGNRSSMASLNTMPNQAAQLDQQLAQSESAATKKKAGQGFQISGKLENRTILKKVIPQYPAWAEEQGIIGTLRLYFTVTPEGAVRPNIKVTKTTGNPQLDQIGIDALKQWSFVAQPGNEDDVQWGIITFTFSLAS
jgi:TonB family protein